MDDFSAPAGQAAADDATNNRLHLGGTVGGADADVARDKAEADAQANWAGPTTDFSGGDQYGSLANNARTGSIGALAAMQQRANGIHTAADASADRANALATASQRSMTMGARGPAAMAGARQQAAGAASNLSINNTNNKNIANAQDTALAQQQVSQGFNDLRTQDASQQHVLDARSQYLADLEASRRAMNDQGQLGYEKAGFGVNQSRSAAELAQGDINYGDWQNSSDMNEFTTNANAAGAIKYGAATANALGSGAAYAAQQGGSDPKYDYTDPGNSSNHSDPGYAKGGRPVPGETAVVGEEGPELFVPDQPGTIIPAPQTSQILSNADYAKRVMAGVSPLPAPPPPSEDLRRTVPAMPLPAPRPPANELSVKRSPAAYVAEVNRLRTSAGKDEKKVEKIDNEISTDDAKLGQLRGPEMGMSLGGVGLGQELGMSAAVQRTMEADAKNRVVEEELANHNKSLFTRAPMSNEGEVELAESPDGARVLSRLTGRDGKTTEPGLSRNVEGLIDNTPARQKSNYVRMLDRNAARRFHGIDVSQEPNQSVDPTAYASQVMSGVNAPAAAPSFVDRVVNSPAFKNTLGRPDTHTTWQEGLLGNAELGRRALAIEFPTKAPVAEAPKASKPDVDPSELVSTDEPRQPVEVQTGDDRAVRSDDIPTYRTIAAHDVDVAGPELRGLDAKAQEERRQAALRMESRNETQAFNDELLAGIHGDVAKENAMNAEKIGKDWHAENKRLTDQYTQDAKALGSYHEDPNHFWSTRSTGQKVMGLIGVILGGFAQGLHGGTNPAMEILNKAKDDDIAAQRHNYMANKDSLDAKKSAYGMAMEKYHNDFLATNAVDLAQNGRIAADLRAQAAQHMGTETKNRLDEALSSIADRDASIHEKNYKYIQAQRTQTGGPNEALLKEYRKYHTDVLEKGQTPENFSNWARGATGGRVADVTWGQKGDSDKSTYVTRPDGTTAQVRNKDDHDDYTQRTLGADKFERAVQRIQKIRESGVRTLAQRAEAEAAAAEAKTAYVQMNGFKRTPNETEFKALDLIIPPHGGEISMTSDQLLGAANKLAEDARKDADKAYLVPTPKYQPDSGRAAK